MEKTKMLYRNLGNSGLKVSVFSLGGWLTYGADYDITVTADCMKVAYEAGVNFFDTAEVYADGKSEMVMGEVIKKFGWKRSSLVISTKIYWGPDRLDTMTPIVNSTGLSRKHIIEGMDASLKRLQLEYVDVVFAHRPDNETPMEEIVRAFNWLIDQNKAFYWGTSEWSAQQITDAHRVAEKLGLIAPIVEQPQYSMLERERFEKEYNNLYRKFNLGTTIWSPLSGGILSGKYTDGVPEGSRMKSDAPFIKNILKKDFDTPAGKLKVEKAAKLKPIADKIGCTTAQLALAWCLKNENVSSIITGASRASQVTENLKSLDFVSALTKEVMVEIEEILQNKPKLETDRF